MWVLLPFGLLIPDLIINYTKRIFWPSPSDKILQLIKSKKYGMMNSSNKYSYPITINSQKYGMQEVDLKAVQKYIGKNQSVKFNTKGFGANNGDPTFMQINVYSSQNISINDSSIVINSPNLVEAQIMK